LNSQPLPKSFGSRSNMVYVEQFRKSNGGTITCKGLNENGQDFLAISILNIESKFIIR